MGMSDRVEIRKDPGRLVVRLRPDARFAWGRVAPAALLLWLALAGTVGLAGRGHPVLLLALAGVGAGFLLGVLSWAKAAWRVEATSDAVSFVRAGLFGERRRTWPAADVARFHASEEADGELRSFVLSLELRDGRRERLARGRTDDLREIADLLARERPEVRSV